MTIALGGDASVGYWPLIVCGVVEIDVRSFSCRAVNVLRLALASARKRCSAAICALSFVGAIPGGVGRLDPAVLRSAALRRTSPNTEGSMSSLCAAGEKILRNYAW